MPTNPDDQPTGDLPSGDSGSRTERFRREFAADDASTGRSQSHRTGQRIAGFELVDRIDKDANNSFGEVWLARRIEPFQRVAIKFLRRDRVNDELVRRFSRAESKALARFNHPYIARFYELGFDEDDTPYLVMQYVPGDRITAYSDKNRLPVRERLELMAKLCDAVQHVHLQGVVHRDLKPANILVTEVRPDSEQADGAATEGKAPIPVLIDFGLAKSANPDAPLVSGVVSGIGSFAGTYAYAAPEQIKQKRDEDTGRQADIYALGAVLFELVVGVSPMAHVLSDTTLDGPERNMRLANDERPSMADAFAQLAPGRQREVAAQRGTTVDAMKRLLRSRLAHLADRALRAKPESRFSDARAFALDIANYLADRDFAEAAAEPRLEKWRRSVRRNRAAFVGVAGVVVALSAGVVATSWQWTKAESQKVQALAAQSRAEDLLAVVAINSALAAAHKPDAAQLQRELETLRQINRADRFGAQLALAMSDASLGEPLRGHEQGVNSVTFSPDGKTLASGSYDETIRRWDASTGTPLGEPLRGHEHWVSSVTFSPDGKTLASGSWDKTIRLWDASTGEPLGEPLRGHKDEVNSVTFSPDGKTLASGSYDYTIRLWDAATGKPLGEPLRGHEGRVTSVTFSPDGKTLASGSDDYTIRLWDASTGKPLGEPLRGHEYGVNSVTFSPDGKTLASGSDDYTIRLWDASTGKPLGEPLRGHESGVTSVTFSSDGKSLASGSFDKTNRLWDASTGKPLGEPLRGHESYVTSVTFSPDGKTLASGSFDKTNRLWDASTGKPLGKSLRGHEERVFSVNFSPDGKTLASAGGDKTIRLWDASTGKPLGEPLRGHESVVSSVTFSPDGKTLASGGEDKTIRLWDASTGKPLGEPLRGHENWAFSVTFSPDGKTLASGSVDGTIRLWDASTGKPLGEPLRGHESVVYSVTFSPDGKTLASGSEDNTIHLWDASTGKPLGEPLRGHDDFVLSVTFSPDGKTLASGSEDYTIRLWDVATGKPIGEPLRGHERDVYSVTFSPDGKTLASGSVDGTIRLWDASTGKPLGEPLRGHESYVMSVTFSADGETLASGSGDNTIRLWRAVPFRDRIGAIRATLAQADAARTLLVPQLAAARAGTTTLRAVQDAVLADPRFAGELRTGALIAIGEASLEAAQAAAAAEPQAR